jgi:ligand-binding sensor protein
MSAIDEKDELTLESLAEQHGVAVVVVDENSIAVASANNNSICSQLYDSADFGAACAEYCGKAYAMATAAGDAVDYECHAGLVCRAVPVMHSGKRLVAIVGRTFLRSENYRRATEKASAGDWRRFSQNTFFDNVLLSGSSAPIERLGRELGATSTPFVDEPAKPARKAKPKAAEPELTPTTPVIVQQPGAAPDPFET